MNILAISGSLRPDSTNSVILRALAAAPRPDVHVHIDDHIGRLPHFIPGDPLPPVVRSFLSAIRAADVVLICTPEYAHGIPGVLKNALDWTVADGTFYEKPVAVITASSQGEHGHAALLEVLGVLTARLIPGAALLIPFVRSRISADGTIADATLAQLLQLLDTATKADHIKKSDLSN